MHSGEFYDNFSDLYRNVNVGDVIMCIKHSYPSYGMRVGVLYTVINKTETKSHICDIKITERLCFREPTWIFPWDKEEHCIRWVKCDRSTLND